MDIRQITPRYAVSPQIAPEDFPGIAAAGFTRVICNRPDSEIPPHLHAAEMARAAEAAGLEFAVLPLTQQTIGPQSAAAQRSACETCDGPVLAYCNSGTRSTVIWALGQVGEMSADEIIAAASDAGYDLRGLHGALSGTTA